MPKRGLNYYIAITFLAFIGGMALLAPILANDLPLYIQTSDKSYYPILEPESKDTFYNSRLQKTEIMTLSDVDWHSAQPNKTILRTFTGYSPQTQSHDILVAPLKNGHIFGTDPSGRDIATWLIWGARASLSVAIPATICIFLLGLLLGGIVGYYGNFRLKISLGLLVGILLSIVPVYFYGFYAPRFYTSPEDSSTFPTLLLRFFLMSICFIFFIFLGKIAAKTPFFSRRVSVPLDTLVRFFTDMQAAVPPLFWLFLIMFILPKGVFSLIFGLIVVGYVNIFRLTRMLFIQETALPYIEAARSLGIPPMQVWRKHILLNLFPFLIPLFVIGLSEIIALEVGLSFLGVGLGSEYPTWGHMLADSRENLSAWWLWLFPVLCIGGSMISLHIIASSFQSQRKQEG